MHGGCKCGLGDYGARTVVLCTDGDRVVHGVPVRVCLRLDKYSQMRKINPVAKAMLQSRRRTTVVPDKKKYNRKKDRDNANKSRKNEINEAQDS